MIHWQPGVTIADIEKQVIVRAYQFFNRNKTKTANSLGISIRTLDKRLDEYGETRGHKKEDVKELPVGKKQA